MLLSLSALKVATLHCIACARIASCCILQVHVLGHCLSSLDVLCSPVTALLPRTHIYHLHLGRLAMVTVFLVHYVLVYTVANVDQPAWANIISYDLASLSITWCDLARLG